MAKFKIGDRVKMAEPICGRWRDNCGARQNYSDWETAFREKKIGTVANNSRGMRIHVEWDNGRSSSRLSDSALVSIVKVYKYKGEEYV